MKILKSIVAVLCVTFTLTAYGNNEKPEAVAKSYIDATLSVDYEKAIKYSSKKLAANLSEGIEDYKKQ